ncbi:CoA transferase [Amycolatopsis balhimycina DSM 5908]|uniref:CoA transferase n=1 Tax=Amycolatopsis balhimycina DSM 5908 TaxID=1081091 RepID=A0A428WVH0_AMYBA|nr:CaiB/BaiF CoA-transferase family protein [Amycolatopsis balhimycina]RSM47078.1 CoA transferase [Amycolatopsis balhimycina DSM 5908]
MPGPLDGIRVLELAGLGPAPYTAMMLADMGADVLRVDRPVSTLKGDPAKAVLNRGRRSVVVDLKAPGGAETVLRLAERADVLVEGFRPGVMERLGLGPDVCLHRNPRLVYGRMTGWGQHGPLAPAAGHDLNYLALSGALRLFARRGQPPATPPGLVADFGGGGMMLAFGVVCALLETSRSGLGQVIDAAMIDGVASLTAMLHGFLAQDRWVDEVGVNFSDGGSPHYDVHETADGRFVAVAAAEPQFYTEFLELLGLDPRAVPDRDDPAQREALREIIADVLRSRTRDEWEKVFDGTDACVTPVLSLTEAPAHPHNRAREVFTTAFDVVQPAPAPRLERTPGAIAGPPPRPGEGSVSALRDWGLADDEIAKLRDEGVIGAEPA